MAVTYYNVTNTSDTPLSLPFNKSLLNPEELEAYYAFKDSDDYRGYSPEEQSARLRVPEAVKAQPFFDALERGHSVRYSVPRQNGKEVIRETTYRREWVLPGDFTKLLDRNINYIADQCTKYRILFSPRETKQQLVDKLKAKLGDQNTITVTDEKERESNTSVLDNLRPFEIRQIRQRLQPGEQTPRIIETGFLKIEEVEGSADQLPPQKYILEDLQAQSYADLRQLAKDNGLPNVGVSKETIIQNLLNV